MKNHNLATKLTLLITVLLSIGSARTRADVLPPVSIGFAPVGVTTSQTARLNFVNLNAANGMLVSWRFIDATGVTLSQATVTLPMGKIVSVDFRSGQTRAEVRAQVDIVTPGVPNESLRQSLEVFNNDTGVTTLCMSGAAQ